MNDSKNIYLPPVTIDPERAGRAVVRACTSRGEMLDFIKISAAERAALDADLASIDEAQKRGLETGSLHIIGVRI